MKPRPLWSCFKYNDNISLFDLKGEKGPYKKAHRHNKKVIADNLKAEEDMENIREFILICCLLQYSS